MGIKERTEVLLLLLYYPNRYSLKSCQLIKNFYNSKFQLKVISDQMNENYESTHIFILMKHFLFTPYLKKAV